MEPAGPSAFAEQVLELVEQIPAGQVLAYGDIAELLGHGGPRQVGRVMAMWGGAVPWWRVVRAGGQPALGHEREALGRLRAERTPLAVGGTRVDMRAGHWAGPADPRGLSGASGEMER